MRFPWVNLAPTKDRYLQDMGMSEGRARRSRECRARSTSGGSAGSAGECASRNTRSRSDHGSCRSACGRRAVTDARTAPAI
jgi:hypothetical protein